MARTKSNRVVISRDNERLLDTLVDVGITEAKERSLREECVDVNDPRLTEWRARQ